MSVFVIKRQRGADEAYEISIAFDMSQKTFHRVSRNEGFEDVVTPM